MASKTPSTDKGPTEDMINYMIAAYQYMDGTINLAKLAEDNQISVEAARKRFNRAFEKLDLKAAVKGNIITGQEAKTPTTATTPKGKGKGKQIETDDDATAGPSTVTTPKRKAKQLGEDDDGAEPSTKKAPKAKTPKSATKKAKKEVPAKQETEDTTEEKEA